MPYQGQLWFTKDIYQLWTCFGAIIQAVTDVPCHLWLRWTLTKPRMHRKPTIRRGQPWLDDIRFCFVNWQDNEQEEDGDTLIHTFDKSTWLGCTTYYYYLHGEVAGEPSVSVSPILEKHPEGKYGETRDQFFMHSPSAADQPADKYRCGQTFTPSFDHYLTRFCLPLFRYKEPGDAVMRIYKCDANHLPAGPVLTSITFRTPPLLPLKGWNYWDMPPYEEWQWQKYNLPPCLLLENVEYCITLHCPLGVQYENCLVLPQYFPPVPGGDQYPRGNSVHSFNSGASWEVETFGRDWNFIQGGYPP